METISFSWIRRLSVLNYTVCNKNRTSRMILYNVHKKNVVKEITLGYIR
jgi:hypothetical protein